MRFKKYAILMLVWIFLFPYDLKAFECPSVAKPPTNGSIITITENTPSQGKVLDRGATVNFSGTISYSNAVSGSYIYIGLLPSPADNNNTSRMITINIISNISTPSGTVNYNGDVKAERDVSDITALLRSFKVRAILFNPQYVCSEIVSDTQAHPVFGTLSLDMLITILRIMSGLTPSDDAIKNIGDVNGDGKIGFEEMIYVMQRIAQLRQ